MPASITYKDLFKITILHGYFLNSGNVAYDNLDTATKKKLANNYTFDQFITIIPTIETAALLKNNKLIVQSKGDTMKVGVRVNSDDPKVTFTGISLDLTLNFIIRIKDFLFENYTDIELSKDQLFYFSNIMPPLPNPNFKNIALLNDNVIIDANYKVTPQNTKALLETLDESEKREVFGILSIKMSSTNADLNILNLDKTIKASTPHFKIHFNNRKTIWKYIQTNTSFNVATLNTKPLVKNGFIEILQTDLDLTGFSNEKKAIAAKLQYPNPSAKSIKKTESNIKYSEIFI
jgi:hypothetical protein